MSTATDDVTTVRPDEVPLPPKGGLWREEVLDRAGRLDLELDALSADDHHVQKVRNHLFRARAHTVDALHPTEWWSGSRVEACWRELRLAEESMLDLGTESEVRARVRDARTHASFYLGDEDQRTKNLSTLLDRDPLPPNPELVPVARIALASSHETSDRQHRERRSFTNTLRVVIGVLVLLAALLLVAVAIWGWEFLPAVGGEPQPALVGIAMLFGALGALFSAVPSLAQMPARAEPFSSVRTQATLKVVVGAWSAVVGLMAVTAGLTEADTANLAGFAMVAALFGAGQEAITRFADHKAADLSSADTTQAAPRP
jgi:hypothetical protein